MQCFRGYVVIAILTLTALSVRLQRIAPVAAGWVFATDAAQPTAHADVVNSVGTVLGTAKFSQEDGGVRIELDVVQQVPGTHAIHIDSVGKCEGFDFKSAGPHFNPDNKQHGSDNKAGPHAGDLPNFVAGLDGHAKASLLAPLVTLGNAANSLFPPSGTSIVIDEDSDDYKTDPDGNSGARVACGVVQK